MASRTATLANRVAVFFVFILFCAPAQMGAARAERTFDRIRSRPAPLEDPSRYVVHISVDGLRADAVRRLGPSHIPHFYRLRVEGAFTDNARSDYDYTVTLPNHACELTSRPVLGADGHGVSFNYDDGRTIAEIHGSYVAGVFDVAHDHGLSTGMYASKSKFAMFERSWNDVNGAPDTVGADNGRDKIDVYVYLANTAQLIDSFVADMESVPHEYSFIHLNDLDAVGHSLGWDSQPYFDAVMRVDELLGRIFTLIDSNPLLTGRTWIVLTADHGGSGTDHSSASDPLDYTIPLCVWGPGVPAGADLYWLNPVSRRDPGAGRPDYAAIPQPIRNGEAANLSLDLLGLGSIPGSSLDAARDCRAPLPGGASDLPAVAITSPGPGTSYEYPSPVTIEVSASTDTGSVVCVDFFANCVRIGSDYTSPYTFEWNVIPFGAYRLTACAVRDDGIAATSSVDIVISSVAAVPEVRLSLGSPPRVFPNPFERWATVAFSLSDRSEVEIEVYDVLGRRMERVYRGLLGEGSHSLDLDARGYSAGLYFLKLRSGNKVCASKLMIVR
jgi:hypothetical protein